MWWLDDRAQFERSTTRKALTLAKKSDERKSVVRPTVSQPQPGVKSTVAPKRATYSAAAQGCRNVVAYCLPSTNDSPPSSADSAFDAMRLEYVKELAKAREAQRCAKPRHQNTERSLNADILKLKITIKNLAQQSTERQVEHAEQLALEKHAQRQAKSQLTLVIEKQARKIADLNANPTKYQKASIDGASAVFATKSQ